MKGALRRSRTSKGGGQQQTLLSLAIHFCTRDAARVAGLAPGPESMLKA
jgi:hypothetical protein